jgi:hypothetical protein
MKALFSHLSYIALTEKQYEIMESKKDKIFKNRLSKRTFSCSLKRIAIYSYEM